MQITYRNYPYVKSRNALFTAAPRWKENTPLCLRREGLSEAWVLGCGCYWRGCQGWFCLEMGRARGSSPLFFHLHWSLLRQTCHLSTLFPSLWKKGTQSANPIYLLLLCIAGGFTAWALSGGYNGSISTLTSCIKQTPRGARTLSAYCGFHFLHLLYWVCILLYWGIFSCYSDSYLWIQGLTIASVL